MKKYSYIPFISILVLAVGTGCGVKGPPLPPVADTPQASDRQGESNSPRPSPTPSKSPTAKKKGKSTGR